MSNIPKKNLLFLTCLLFSMSHQQSSITNHINDINEEDLMLLLGNNYKVILDSDSSIRINSEDFVIKESKSNSSTQNESSTTFELIDKAYSLEIDILQKDINLLQDIDDFKEDISNKKRSFSLENLIFSGDVFNSISKRQLLNSVFLSSKITFDERIAL
jgi:hypothetical protein